MRDTGLLGDVSDPARVESLVREHAHRGVEDLAPFLFGPRRALAQGRGRVVVASRGMQPPLEGQLVVDLSRYLPGAFASTELLRLGARVVRVEQPGGDPMRDTAPGWFDALNAGKESVVCDLPAEAPFLRSLLARADVILETWRPGVATRLGVRPRDVPERAVYCSITGFGSGGRHEQRAGHDLNYQGWAGVLDDTAPAWPPVQIADLAAGALGAVTEVLAALLARERTGRGGRIVVSMTHNTHRLASFRLAGDPLPQAADGRSRLLPHLRDRRRPLPHGRRARDEVLHAALRAARPARARRGAVRAGPGGAGRDAGRDLRVAAARGVARRVRRRGRLRRAGRDARGGRRRPRHAAAGPRGRARRAHEALARELAG